MTVYLHPGFHTIPSNRASVLIRGLSRSLSWGDWLPAGRSWMNDTAYSESWTDSSWWATRIGWE